MVSVGILTGREGAPSKERQNLLLQFKLKLCCVFVIDKKQSINITLKKIIKNRTRGKKSLSKTLRLFFTSQLLRPPQQMSPRAFPETSESLPESSCVLFLIDFEAAFLLPAISRRGQTLHRLNYAHFQWRS